MGICVQEQSPTDTLLCCSQLLVNSDVRLFCTDTLGVLKRKTLASNRNCDHDNRC